MHAFADTAPLFASSALSQVPFKYITLSHNVSQKIKDFTSKLCAGDEKLVIYRVGELDFESLLGVSHQDWQVISHVHYKSGSDLDLEVDESCSVEYRFGSVGDASESPASVIYVDLDDGVSHKFEDLLAHKHVIVQLKPKFATSHSHGDSIKEFLGETKDFLDEALHLNLNNIDKRSYESDDEDLENDNEYEDLEDEYRAAEALLVANEDEVEGDVETTTSKPSKDTKRKTNSNLFTEYQFFTPGVWLAIIVSLFLVYVATTAVSWITSIELSYKSFEKQIDYEKKNE